MDNLKDLLNMRDSLVMEVVYRQGLKDGIDVNFYFQSSSKKKRKQFMLPDTYHYKQYMSEQNDYFAHSYI